MGEFLSLFGESCGGCGGGGGGGEGEGEEDGGGKRDYKKNPRTDDLSGHEQQLLTQLREMLFEKQSQMKTMFQSLDTCARPRRVYVYVCVTCDVCVTCVWGVGCVCRGPHPNASASGVARLAWPPQTTASRKRPA